MCDICICTNPLTSEERGKFEELIMKTKSRRKLRNTIWKLPAIEAIRFLHYLVQQNYKMQEYKKYILGLPK